LTSTALSQLQQLYEKMKVFNIFELRKNYNYEDVIIRGEVLNVSLVRLREKKNYSPLILASVMYEFILYFLEKLFNIT